MKIIPFHQTLKELKKQKPKAKLPKSPSIGEATFELQLKADKILFEREYRFHDTRKWRFDFLIYAYSVKMAVEIEGGTWLHKGHTGGVHFRSDCEKYNEAQKLGYQVYRFTTDMVKSGEAINFIRDIVYA